MSPLGWVLFALPLLGALAVAGVAMTKVREKDEQAAFLMAGGAGAYVLFALVRQFAGGVLPADLLWLVNPFVLVVSVGLVVFGLMRLLDTQNPKRTQPLPPMLATLPPYKPNLFIRGFFGFFGAMGILSGGLRGEGAMLLFAVMSLVALGAVLAGSYLVDQQGPPYKWVLERRPELIIWTYVHSLTVVNRRYGTRTVTWSAQLGLQSGAVVGIPAAGESAAQQLCASVSMMRPGILIGYSPENLSKFKAQAKASSAPSASGPGNPGGGIQSF